MPAQTYDSQFERTFADIAFAALQDAAPDMVNYLTGFQVLDVNDDQTKAVGIFGVQIGKESIYIPMFFLNGELKGEELMYLKNQDIFAPLDEGWMNYITNRKAPKLGEGSSMQRSDISRGSMDLFNMMASPERFGKSSSAEATTFLIKIAESGSRTRLPVWGNKNPGLLYEDGKEALTKMANVRQIDSIMAMSNLDAMTFMQRNGLPAVQAVVDLLSNDQTIKQAFFKFYQPKHLQEVTLAVTHGSEKQAQVGEADLTPTVVTYSDRTAYDNLGLTDDDKQKLLSGKMVVKDHRDSTSKVIPLSTKLSSTNVSGSGIFEIYCEGGKFIESVVITSPILVGSYLRTSPFSDSNSTQPFTSYSANRKQPCVVAPLEGKGCWVGGSNKLFTNSQTKIWPKEDYKELRSCGSFEVGGHYILCDSSGNGTEPFKVIETSKSGDVTCLKVTADLTGDSYHAEEGKICIDPQYTGNIQKIKDGTVIASKETACCVKLNLELGNTKPSPSERYEPPPLNYGMPKPEDPNLIERAILHCDDASILKLYSTGSEFDISIGKGSEVGVKTASWLNEVEAVRYLMEFAGVHGNDAQNMVKQAQVDKAKGRSTKFAIFFAENYPRLVKSASPYLRDTNIQAPVMPEAFASSNSLYGVPTTYPREQSVIAESLLGGYGDPAEQNRLPRDDPKTTIQQAADTGQKEVFDVALLSNLVNTTRSEGVVDSYVGDLILGMDRIGRIYFMLLQHHEDFKERYGEEDLMELENNLRDTFSGTGKLILFLKQKAIKNPSTRKPELEG